MVILEPSGRFAIDSMMVVGGWRSMGFPQEWHAGVATRAINRRKKSWISVIVPTVLRGLETP